MSILPDRLNYWEVLEQASGEFLTAPLPPHHTEWSEGQLDNFLEEHTLEAYQDYDADGMWKLIENSAESWWRFLKGGVK
jgi:hypothetical protein